MSCALVNVSWLAVTVPAPSTPSGVCGVVRGNIIFTTEKYPKEKSKPSCVFSTKPVWTWVGAHKRLLLSISRNKAGSFGGNKKNPWTPSLVEDVIAIYPQQQHASQQSSGSLGRNLNGRTSGCPGIAMRHCHSACPLWASISASVTAMFSSYNDDQLLSHFPSMGNISMFKNLSKTLPCGENSKLFCDFHFHTSQKLSLHPHLYLFILKSNIISRCNITSVRSH